MIFESFFNYLNFKNKNELLASIEEHGELKLINKGIRCGVDLWHYNVEIIGMEGRSDNWNISLANYKHKPKESISVIGFARNGDHFGMSTDFAASGPNFLRYVLPKALAHHYKTMGECGIPLTTFSMGAEDVNPDMVKRKQRVYQSMFSDFEHDDSPESVIANELFNRMSGRGQSLPMMSFRIPRHLTIL